MGDGSPAVCDKGPGPSLGGVPSIDPTDFDPNSQSIADALNDFACRFVPHTRIDEACTRDELGNDTFVSNETSVQFCFEPAVGAEVAFPVGDTMLTALVRDEGRGLGDPVQIVVRVIR